MADIQVQCTQCDNSIPVSEYVDLSLLKCRKCGGAMTRAGTADPAAPVATPATPASTEPVTDAPAPAVQATSSLKSGPAKDLPAPSTTGRKKLTLRADEPVEEPGEEAESAGGGADGGRWQELQQAKRAKNMKDAKKIRIPTQVWWWLTFIVLGSIMGYVRYGGVLDAAMLDGMALAAPIAVGVLFFYTVTLAFKDSVFQGILCMLVPGWFLYYLFFVSDKFVLRSLVAGVLVGLGQDAGMYFFDKAGVFVAMANDWIGTGGGAIR